MKVGETWIMKSDTLKALFDMGAHPISVGSPKTVITAINGEMIEHVRIGKERVHYQNREEFIKMYEKYYGDVNEN